VPLEWRGWQRTNWQTPLNKALYPMFRPPLFRPMLRPMFRNFAAAVALIASQGAVMAQSVAPIDTLFRALGLPEIIEIMREEGISYGTDLKAELFGGRGGSRWNAMVEDIYDTTRMQTAVRNRMDTELAADDLAPMIDFFASERGQRIIALEVSARRALLDAGVEDASKDALAAMIADDDARLTLLREFSDASDLVENNVVGALNSNYAFFKGLVDGGAFPGVMSQEEILADVWNQEAAIRADTEEWLFSYLALAYQPLSDDELKTYTAFFQTDAGVSLNRAIFAAFDEMFVMVSLALGQGAAQFMAGQEL